MPQELRKDQGPYQAGDVKLKLVPTMTEEEARAWLAQTVAPSGEPARTIDAKEVQGA